MFFLCVPYSRGLPGLTATPLEQLLSLQLAPEQKHPGLWWWCLPRTGPRRHPLWLPPAVENTDTFSRQIHQMNRILDAKIKHIYSFLIDIYTCLTWWYKSIHYLNGIVNTEAFSSNSGCFLLRTNLSLHLPHLQTYLFPELRHELWFCWTPPVIIVKHWICRLTPGNTVMVICFPIQFMICTMHI